MLELQNVTIKMRSDDRVLVESFSFALADSDKAVIIGEEGNGKSTLLQFIYDRELIEGYCDCTGTLRKDGKLGYCPRRQVAHVSDSARLALGTADH